MAAADTEVFSGGEPARIFRVSARSAASVGGGGAIAALGEFVRGVFDRVFEAALIVVEAG